MHTPSHWGPYSAAFARYRGADRPRARRWVQRIRGLLASQGCGHGLLLDLGCGMGRFLLPLAATFEQAIGIDLEPAMLRLARAAQARGSLVRRAWLLQADASCLPLRDQCADLVLASMLLEHVRDLPATLKEMSRVLAPKGLLLLRLMLPGDVQRSDWYRCSAAARRLELRRCLNRAEWRQLSSQHGLRLVRHASFSDRMDPLLAGQRQDRVRTRAYEVLHHITPVQHARAVRQAQRLDAAHRPERSGASLLALRHAAAPGGFKP